MVENDHTLELHQQKIDMLASELEVSKNVVNLTLENCDNVEQYTRRYSLRVYGVPVEKNENVLKNIEECYNSLGIPFNCDEIDRAHHIGKKKFNETSQKDVQPIIVKFKNWNSRYRFYKARPKYNQMEKPGEGNFSVGLDLTRRRYDLLNYAREKIRDGNINGISYAFADVNCALGIRFADDSLRFFNNKESLIKLLNA